MKDLPCTRRRYRAQVASNCVRNLRKLDEGLARSSLCISATGSINHLLFRVLVRSLCVYLASSPPLSLSSPLPLPSAFPIFSVLFALHSTLLFALIIFHMHVDTARFARTSPVTRFLYFHGASRCTKSSVRTRRPRSRTFEIPKSPRSPYSHTFRSGGADMRRQQSAEFRITIFHLDASRFL